MADTANLIVALKLQDGLSSGLGRVSDQLTATHRSLGQVGRGIGQVAGGFDRILTRGAIAAGAALVGVVTTAASFEQAFTGVEKTVDGTEAELAELEDTLRQMARTMPVAFEELAAIGEAGGALGVATESLDEFIDVVARLAVSTDLTAETASVALGQLGTVLHLEGAEFEQFADSLVALGNAGASTESQIVEMAARFAAAGNSAGLTKEEILALASATASMGIEVEAGGTALSQTFNNIATGIGTGSDEIEAFTDLMGISADEFKKRWSEDALGTFQDFLFELSKLDQFEQAAVLEDAGITGVRQLNAIKLMTQNLGFFEEQLLISRDAAGELDEESQKFFDTSQGQWIILKNNIRDAAATIGTELLPIFNELAGEFVDFLNQEGTQSAIKDFASDLATGIRDLITQVKSADFSLLIESMERASDVARTAFDLFNKLPPDIKALAIGAVAVNKVSGGAVGGIARGLVNILGGIGGGLLGRGSSPANAVWVQSVAGGVGGTGAGGGAGGILAGAARLTVFGLIALTVGEVLAQNVTRPLNEIAFDFNQIAGASGQFSSQQAAERFAVRLADSLNVPLANVKEGIVHAVLTQGMTWDEAIAALIAAAKGIEGAFKGEKTIKGAFKEALTLPDTAFTGGGGMLPDTAMDALTTTSAQVSQLPPILTDAERAAQQTKITGRLTADRLALTNSLLSQQLGRLGGILAKPQSFTVNTSTTVNIDGRKVSGTLTKNQILANPGVM